MFLIGLGGLAFLIGVAGVLLAIFPVIGNIQNWRKGSLIFLGSGLASMVLGSTFFKPQIAETTAPEPTSEMVTVTITSDPSEANVYLQETLKGKTPATVSVPKGQPTPYRVEVEEVNSDLDLYKPFSGVLNVSENQGISVWLERTTAEEQQAQQTAALAAKLEGLESSIAVACEQMVKNSLKAPRTAKFAGIFSGAQKYRYEATAGVAVYASYVDAENSFGAMLRNEFACSYALSTDTIKLEYLR